MDVVSDAGSEDLCPPARGPLRVCADNPRYFSDGSGRAVYLTGAHTWCNLRDMGNTYPPRWFDYSAYLDFLVRHHHNFVRLWTWELFQHADKSGELIYTAPFPWPRTGPGAALDGKPKFDLSRFDDSYFDRLRSRAAAAGRRGIYVSVMLFEGWGIQFTPTPWCWDGHPFNAHNNVNGVNGDPEGTGRGLAVNTLAIPAVLRAQEVYVRQVVDCVNDLDNVLYEICNEAGPYSTEWQCHMIRYVKQHQSAKAKQHPVGMTFQYQGGSNRVLFESPADWVSPNPEGPAGYDYTNNPPPGDGSKVILSDTDHLWGIGGDQGWVWKSFCRGLNPLFMDPYLHEDFYRNELKRVDPRWEPIRTSLGHTRRFAERIGLTRALPAGELADTGYCLAVPGEEYVVYLPEGGRTRVDLSAASGPLAVEWFKPGTGESVEGPVMSGGRRGEFVAPFSGDNVLYVRRVEAQH